MQFNFFGCSHPGNTDPAWLEYRPKMVGRTELHNQEFHDLQSADLLEDPKRDKMDRKHDSSKIRNTVTPPLDETAQEDSHP